MRDKVNGTLDMSISTLKNKGGNINLSGQYGLMDYLALNYGTQYNLTEYGYELVSQKYKTSPEFENYYLGLTGKIYNYGKQKAYLTLNVGQNTSKKTFAGIMFMETNNTYVDLSAKYGLDLNNYNVALNIGGVYTTSSNTDFQEEGSNMNLKTKSTKSLYTVLENEVKLGKVNLGLDLYYSLNSEEKTSSIMGSNVIYYGTKSYNEYGVSLSADYALNDTMYLGIYGFLYKNDKSEFLDTSSKDGTSTEIGSKNGKGYTYGVKLTKSF